MVFMARARASRRTRLRAIVAGATLLLAGVAATVAIALVVLTTLLHGAGAVLRDSVAGVRLAKDTQIALLLHERAQDHAVRAEMENGLHHDLQEAARHVTSNEERGILDRAVSLVDAYVAAVRAPTVPQADRAGLFDSAYGSLKELADLNVAQADAAQDEVVRWDTLANAIGVPCGLVMLAILGALALWINRAAIRPLYALSSAVDRFGAGALDARASDAGAVEIRDIAMRFNAMATSLERQHRGRLAYLAGVAHDLRNPLAALQVSVSLNEPSDERERRMVSIMRRQITLLNRMVGDLLDASRIEAGHLDLRLSEADLRDVVLGVATLFEGTSPLHDIRADVPDEPLHIRCDVLRIEQTLNNLVSNAIRYSPHGGEVRITAQRSGDAAVVSVTDHGIGIAEEDIPRIWEPFRRVGASTEAIPGVGLGLAIAKRIVEAHGGTIALESRVSVGSTFSIRVPLPHGDARGASARPERQDASAP